MSGLALDPGPRRILWPVDQSGGRDAELGCVEFDGPVSSLWLSNGRVGEAEIGDVHERVYLEPKDLARNGEYVVELEVDHVSCPPACSEALDGARDSVATVLGIPGPCDDARHAR